MYFFIQKFEKQIVQHPLALLFFILRFILNYLYSKIRSLNHLNVCPSPNLVSVQLHSHN